MVRLLVAGIIGAVLGAGGDYIANKSDPGVATETLAQQDSIQIEAPPPAFDHLPLPESEEGP